MDVIGSGNLVQTLLRNDLSTGGTCGCFRSRSAAASGQFAEGTVPTALRLAESATFSKDAVHLTYERRQADLRQHGLAVAPNPV